MIQQTQIKSQNWKKVELGEVADFKRGPFGSSVQKSVCVPKGKKTYKLYEQGNVINNDFERGEYYLSQVKFDELKNFDIKSGDILITCAGTLGRIAIVPAKFEKGIINSVLMRIRIDKNKIDRNYFLYFFRSSNVQNDIQSKSAGVAVKNLFATKQLKKFLIPLPSLQEQSLIVQEIEKQFTRLDESVKSLKAVKQKLEVYRKAVLKKAFEKKESWEEKKIKEVCTLINGKAFKTSEWAKQGLPIIRIQNLNNKDAKFNYLNSKVEDKYHVENGQLLFAWSGTPGTSFGAHIWNRGKAVLNQHIFKVNMDEREIDKIFLMHLFNKNVQEYVIKAHGTAGLAHITKGKFEDSMIYLPKTIQEQQSIVQLIEDKFSIIDKLEKVIDISLEKAEKLRKSILKSAFEGKLVKMGEVRE